jgi:hypothetical protein
MSQLTGPVGLGPIDPYYYSGEYEKEEEKKRAAEQLELEQKTKEDATPKTSNPIQGLLDLGEVLLAGALRVLLMLWLILLQQLQRKLVKQPATKPWLKPAKKFAVCHKKLLLVA